MQSQTRSIGGRTLPLLLLAIPLYGCGPDMNASDSENTGPLYNNADNGFQMYNGFQM